MVLGVLGLCNVHNGETEIATLSEYQGKMFKSCILHPWWIYSTKQTTILTLENTILNPQNTILKPRIQF